jgi:hypothetical protein
MTARQQAWRVGAALVAVLLLLGGCAGGRDEDAAMESSGDDTSGAGEEVAPGRGGQGSSSGDSDASEGAAAGEADAGFGDEASGLAVDTVALAQQREVIRTGEMWMTVDDVDEAAGAVRTVAGEAEGFVGDEQVRARDDEADITVRVPAADFDDVRAGIAELGDVREQRVEAQDVTAEMVDVETRIESLRASVERLQELLDGAGDVAQLAAVEGELASRETELEALLGQQRVLRDQVALATLTVHLSEDDEPMPSDDAAGFGDGLRQGWATAIDIGRALLAALGFLLPFAPVLLAAALLARFLTRRRHAPATPPPPGAPPTPPAPASGT